MGAVERGGKFKVRMVGGAPNAKTAIEFLKFPMNLVDSVLMTDRSAIYKVKSFVGLEVIRH